MQTMCPHCHGRGYSSPSSRQNIYDPDLSPIHNLLGTTYQIPSPTQAVEIRRTVQITEKSISAVDEEIARLEETLFDLQSKRREMMEYTKAHKALIAPARTLPTELLAEIFTLCLSENWHDRRFDVRQAPLLLSNICKRWREIALSTPFLWSTLIFDSNKASPVALARTWLARSATVPLYIKISQPFVDTCGQDWTINVLNLLVAETERWEHIDIWARYRINSHMLPFKNRLPALKSITVAIPPEVSDNTIFSPFTEVPLLRDLRIVQGRGSHPPLMFRVAHPPWSQLTCLSVIMPDCKFLQEILPGAMSLVTLELYDISSCYDTAITTISLPNLKRLTFEAANPRAPNTFFPYVTFPSLDSLNISYGSSAQAGGWLGQSNLLACLERSSCSLKQISMNCVPIAPDEIRELLGMTPDLRSLELQGSSSQIFDGISTSCLAGLDASTWGTASCLVPKLETIICEIYGCWEPLAFMNMVRSRLALTATPTTPTSHPLKEVVLKLTLPLLYDQERIFRLDPDSLVFEPPPHNTALPQGPWLVRDKHFLIRDCVREFQKMGLDISIMVRNSYDDPFNPIPIIS